MRKSLAGHINVCLRYESTNLVPLAKEYDSGSRTSKALVGGRSHYICVLNKYSLDHIRAYISELCPVDHEYFIVSDYTTLPVYTVCAYRGNLQVTSKGVLQHPAATSPLTCAISHIKSAPISSHICISVNQRISKCAL
jgi:hypothetical protein